MLTIKNSLLVVIDIQGNLAQAMHDKKTLFENLKKIISGAQLLNIPIIVTEQIPEKLGATIPELAGLFSEFTPITKTSFSCWGEKEFAEKVQASSREQILLAGIESHVCVYQTALELKNLGYEVYLVADCIASRTAENKSIAIARMTAEGIKLTSTEMALFELMKTATAEKFREVSKVVK